MAKYAAKGALLAKATVGAPSTYVTIAGVRDFSLGLGSADLIDVTSHDSAGSYKEYVTGMLDSDEMSIPIIWDGANTQHAELLAALQAGTSLNYRITGKETSPKVYTFAGVVRSLNVNWTLAGPQEATLVLKPTGAITVT